VHDKAKETNIRPGNLSTPSAHSEEILQLSLASAVAIITSMPFSRNAQYELRMQNEIINLVKKYSQPVKLSQIPVQYQNEYSRKLEYIGYLKHCLHAVPGLSVTKGKDGEETVEWIGCFLGYDRKVKVPKRRSTHNGRVRRTKTLAERDNAEDNTAISSTSPVEVVKIRNESASSTSDTYHINSLTEEDPSTQTDRTKSENGECKPSASVSQELKDIKSMLAELMHQNARQVSDMQSKMGDMLHENASLRGKINEMAVELDGIKASHNQELKPMKSTQQFHTHILSNLYYQYWPDSEYWVNQRNSYLESIQDDDVLVVNTWQFFSGIRNQTLKIIRGESTNVVLHCDGPVLYNEAFSYYWTLFIEALRDHRYMLACQPPDKESTFEIQNVEIPPENIEDLSRIVKPLRFTALCLCFIPNFGRAVLQLALSHAENNPILTRLSLEGNSIVSSDDIDQLCRVIKGHQSLKELNLNACFEGLPNSFDIFSSILTAGQNNIKCLGFSGNSVITPIGRESTFLPNFLAANSKMEVLHLMGNKLGDQDALLISEALHSNTNLGFLEVEKNAITSVGERALEKSVGDVTNLNSISDSNHTCWIELEGIACANSGDTDANRWRKIYSKLSSLHVEKSIYSQLRDTPVELLPDLLCSIQKYSEYHLDKSYKILRDVTDVQPLSIVYKLMRNRVKELPVFEVVK